MGNKVTTLYDFTLTANGSQQIQADANFYKILTASGDVSITRDGGSTVKPMRAGRGERNVQFLTLTIRDLSGAPNAGTILVGDSDFIDDTIVLSSAINVRPEVASGSFSNVAAVTVNVPITVFTPGANANGAILLQADMSWSDAANSPCQTFLSKSGVAPAGVMDGAVYAQSKILISASGNYAGGGSLQKEQYIPAGDGLYFISGNTMAGGGLNSRSCRYKFL